MPTPFGSQKHIDVRDSVFSVIRGLQPTTTEALVGLCNALGAVIAEHIRTTPADRDTLVNLVRDHLPRYIDTYTTMHNPLRKD